MNAIERTPPLVGKGKRFPFQVAVACWVDLLGYGDMISRAGFNPLHPQASEAIGRLRRFHRIVAEHSERHFPTLVMNDGAVAYRDLSLRSRSVTHDFLCRSWSLFQALTREEQSSGYPGARMVIATGFRASGRRAGIDERTGRFGSIIRRLGHGEINATQALREAARLRSDFDVLPQLQANFAFTKAYIAEQSGTKGGLPGPGCFVDMAMFSTSPPWLILGENVAWRHHQLDLSAEFAPIREIVSVRHPEGGPTEARDGLQVAQHLAQGQDVLKALRTARMTAYAGSSSPASSHF